MKINQLALQLKIFFEGRQNALAEQMDSGGYRLIKRSLHLEDFEQHLNGKKTIGIYLIIPETNTVNFCALDIDNRDNEFLRRIIFSCRKIGIADNQILLEDSGNKGRHIFFRFDAPTLAKEARNLLNIILKIAEIDLPIELFPKQDKIEPDEFGNLIKLPLGIHKTSQKRSFFMDLNTYEKIDPEGLKNIKYINKSNLNDIFEAFNYLLPKNTGFNIKNNHKTPEKTKNEDFQCINNILNGVKEGNRDICLFNLCIYLLKIKKLPPNIARETLFSWNSRNNPPLNESEIDQKINNILNHDYDHISCSQLKQFCEPNCPKLLSKENSVKINKQKTSFLITEKNIIETVYSEEKGSLFAIFDISDQSIKYSNEFQHKNTLYIPYTDDLIKSRIVLLPFKAEEYGDLTELIKEIKQFIHKYVDLPNECEDLCSYYIVFSYIADCFDICPYIRFKGDYGTGKSRAIFVIGSICYKATIIGGATTTSPIFRLIDKYRGTLILDEADFKNSEASDEIMKILNTGYMKRSCILRTEKTQDFEVKAFECYSPKVLATRYSWQDKALESRCITIEMMGKTRNDIPYNIKLKQFDQETLNLRNKLLMFRFKNYGERDLDESLADQRIESRLNQIMLPLLSVIENSITRMELQDAMKSLNKHLIDDRNLTNECDVLKIILEIWTPTNTSISLKELTKKVNELDDSKIDKLFTEKRLAKIIREKLYLPTERKRSGTEIIVTYDKLEKLKKRFGLVNE